MHRLALPTLLLLAAALRLSGVTFGLPELWHPDERESVPAVRELLAGDPLMGHYRHPPLLKYLTAWILLPWTDPSDADVVLAMRLVSALCSTAEVLLVWRLAAAALRPGAALACALGLAVLPLHITCARYGVPDALQAMLTTAALGAQLEASRRGGRWLMVAGVVTGLAITAKYVGALLVPGLLWVTHTRRAEGRSTWWAACGGAALGLLLGMPTALWELGRVGSQVGLEWHHVMVSDKEILTGGGLPGLSHLSGSIGPTAGPLLTVLLVLGVARATLRRDPVDLLLLGFLLPAWALFEVANQVPVGSARYVLPLLAPGLVLAARALPPMSGPKSAALWALLLLFPAWRTARLQAALRSDTRAEMSAWVDQHLDLNKAIVVDRPETGFYPELWRSGRMVLDWEPRAGVGSKRAAYVLVSSLGWERYLEDGGDSTERGRWYRELLSQGELVHTVSPDYLTWMYHDPELRLYRAPTMGHPRRVWP